MSEYVKLMTKGTVVFEDVRMCLRVNKPDDVKEDEINQLCNNFARLTSLMDSVFSTLHSKRGEVTIDKINILKEDLGWASEGTCCYYKHTPFKPRELCVG